MIVVYNRMKKKELIASVKEAKTQITTWFEQNPKKKICNAQMWYGRMVKVRRNNICEDIDTYANELLKEYVKKSTKKE